MRDHGKFRATSKLPPSLEHNHPVCCRLWTPAHRLRSLAARAVGARFLSRCPQTHTCSSATTLRQKLGAHGHLETRRLGSCRLALCAVLCPAMSLPEQSRARRPPHFHSHFGKEVCYAGTRPHCSLPRRSQGLVLFRRKVPVY